MTDQTGKNGERLAREANRFATEADLLAARSAEQQKMTEELSTLFEHAIKQSSLPRRFRMLWLAVGALILALVLSTYAAVRANSAARTARQTQIRTDRALCERGNERSTALAEQGQVLKDVLNEFRPRPGNTVFSIPGVSQSQIDAALADQQQRFENAERRIDATQARADKAAADCMKLVPSANLNPSLDRRNP